MGMPGEDGLPHQDDLRRDRAVGLQPLALSLALALQAQLFGGEGAGRFDGAAIFLPPKSSVPSGLDSLLAQDYP
jgi:hypothetical protein